MGCGCRGKKGKIKKSAVYCPMCDLKMDKRNKKLFTKWGNRYICKDCVAQYNKTKELEKAKPKKVKKDDN